MSEEDKSNRMKILLGAATVNYGYMESVRADLQDFISNELLPTSANLLSVTNCPLRTPLQLAPHHSGSLTDFQAYLHGRLEPLSAEMTSYQTLISTKIESLLPVNDIPSTEKLRQWESSSSGIGEFIMVRLRLIMGLIDNGIRKSSDDLWVARATLTQEISRSFREFGDVLSYETTNFIQRLSAQLMSIIALRKEGEMHMIKSSSSALLPKEGVDKRDSFYDTRAVPFVSIQTNLMKDMLGVLKSILNDKFILPISRPELEAEYRSKLDDFELKANSVLTILDLEKKMAVPQPILRTNMIRIQKWLLKFQKFMIGVLETNLPNFNSAVSSSDSQNLDALLQQSGASSRPVVNSAFMVLNPSIISYFVRVRNISNDNIGIMEIKKKQLEDTMKQHKIQLKGLTESTKDLMAPSSAFSRYNNLGSPEEVTRHCNEMIKLQGDVEAIQSEQAKTSKNYNTLEPLLVNHKALLASLNNIVSFLNNQASVSSTEKWVELIEIESQICEFERKQTIDYHETILVYRNHTRQLLGMTIKDSIHVLDCSMRLAFDKLMKTQKSIHDRLERINEDYLANISRQRDTIHMHLTGIVSASETDRMNSLMISSEIDRVLKQWNAKIEQKKNSDAFEYKLGVQVCFLILIETMRLTVKEIAENKVVVSYMTILDHMCCSDNKIGGLIAPRRAAANEVPSEHAWIQLSHYPDRIDPTQILTSNSISRARDINSFIGDRGYSHDGQEVQDSEEKYQKTINDILNSF